MGKLCAQETVYKNTLLYSQKQGLSSPNIHKIIQDKYGFIWIATQDGLNRFDGRSFIKYNLDLPAGKQLFSADVRDIVMDEKGDFIWAINNNGGINGIDLITGRTVFSVPYNNETSQTKWRICATGLQNKIFIASSFGLEVFDCGQKKFVKSPALQSSALLSTADIRWIDSDVNSNLIIAVLNRGVFIIDSKTFAIKKEYVAERKNSVNEEFWPLCGTFFNGGYYLGTKNGIFTFRSDEDRSTNTMKEALVRSGINSGLIEVNFLSVIKKDQLLIGSNQLYIFNSSKNIRETIYPTFSNAASWLNNTTGCILDKEGNLWIGSRQGLCMLKKNEPVFKAFKNEETLFNGKLGHVYALCKCHQSVFLTGTNDGLFEIFENKKLRQLSNKGLVQNICRLDSNIVFFSGNAGIKLYEKGKVYEVGDKFQELKSYSKWQINSIVKVNDSITLIGTESNQGILKWNRKTRAVINYSEDKPGLFKLASKIVNAIYLTRSGQAVVLSDYLFSVFDAVKGTFIPIYITDKKNPKPMGVYMQMAESKDNYWLAAYGYGLIKLDKKFNVIKKFGYESGFSNTGLYSIFNFKDSLLLITSNYGVINFSIGTEKIINCFEEDGLHNNTFEEACNYADNKIFYAGGVNGFTQITPANLLSNTTAPYFFFTKSESESNNGFFSDSFNLNAKKYVFPNTVLQAKIYFTGINYTNPGRVIYKYRILENSKEWISNGSENFVPFIATNPGTYHLQVIAANEDGVWSTPKELILIFKPKWYQTWWFYLLIALTVAAILYALYRYRISQIKKQHEIRKNIATDLHDDLGSTLNSVKVFTNLAISGVKQEESLQQVKDNLTEATMSLRDMIWVLDDSLDTVDELITRIKQFAIPVAGASNIEVIIKADSDVNSRQLAKEEKRNLFLICKEAINNSIKYSGASRIDVDITASGKKIQIVVADNGKGFNVEEVKKGYGLKNMQYRAGQIKYKVVLQSAPGKGTQVIIYPS
jgi:signal transduction histidine kinase/ligand-binding sensor domain-containing protein